MCGVGLQPPMAINKNNQYPVDNRLRDTFTMQQPRYHNDYMVNFNISNSDKFFVLPPLQLGHTNVANSSLMEMLNMRSLFAGLASDNSHAHIGKFKVV